MARATQILIRIDFEEQGGVALNPASITGLAVYWNGVLEAHTSFGTYITINPNVSLGRFWFDNILRIDGTYNGISLIKRFRVWGQDETFLVSFATDSAKFTLSYSPYHNVIRAYDSTAPIQEDGLWPDGTSDSTYEFPVYEAGDFTFNKNSTSYTLSYTKENYVMDAMIQMITSTGDEKAELIGLGPEARIALDALGQHRFDMNGVEQLPVGDLEMEATLFDHEGVAIQTDSYSLPVFTTPLAWVPSTWPFNITPEPAGAYTVQYVLKHYFNGNTTPYYQVVRSVRYRQIHWLDVSEDEDGNMILENMGASTASIELYTLEEDDDGTLSFVLDSSYSINSGDTLTIEEQGVFKIQADGDSYAEFVYVNYQSLQQCVEKFILDSVCSKHDDIKLLRILPLMYLFFAKLHNEYVNNYYYEIIDQSKMKEMWGMQSLAERIEKHCEDCMDELEDCGC